MPNWTCNTITLKGSHGQRAAFKKRVNGENGPMDFNRLVPMPQHSATFYADGPLGKDEENHYGQDNWYHWSRAHWGTKWNACEGAVDDEDDRLTFFFLTAWDAPRPLIEPIVALAHELGLTVVWDCDHEDGGYESLVADDAAEAA